LFPYRHSPVVYSPAEKAGALGVEEFAAEGKAIGHPAGAEGHMRFNHAPVFLLTEQKQFWPRH
jgi:hypothetical protein